MEKLSQKTRETFVSPGIPESKSLAEKREQYHLQKMIENEEIGKSAELEKILNEIDFDLLRSLYERTLVKSGIPADRINFISKERIYAPIKSLAVLGEGSYEADVNIITLRDSSGLLRGVGRDQIRYEREMEKLISVYGSFEMAVIAALFHEQAHAISRNTCTSFKPGLASKDRLYPEVSQSGLTKKTKGNPPSFLLLNEAITEKLGRQLLIEYLELTGFPEKDLISLKNTFSQKGISSREETETYHLDIILLDRIINTMARKNGITDEVAWQAFIRAYMHGETFQDKDVIELFRTTFGPMFLEDLKTLQPQYKATEKRIRNFVEKYNLELA